jgi:zinc transport system ATP-binding protein
VTVVGPNGGGKTTLLKLILGLIHPTAGTVRVFGRPPVEARTRIGYVPQHSLADQSFPVRVLDVVLTGRLERRRVFGGYGAADRDAAMEALREVELCEHASRPFATLSGGLRQRTLIARALASQPDILLLDEPTANLDVMMEGELYALLRRLHERLTILLVTHDLGFVSDFSKTVVCVKRTIAVHPTGELTGELISEMYGRDVRAVLHDRDHHRDGGR